MTTLRLCGGNSLSHYVTHEPFARSKNPSTFYSEKYKAWYIKEFT